MIAARPIYFDASPSVCDDLKMRSTNLMHLIVLFSNSRHGMRNVLETQRVCHLVPVQYGIVRTKHCSCSVFPAVDQLLANSCRRLECRQLRFGKGRTSPIVFHFAKSYKLSLHKAGTCLNRRIDVSVCVTLYVTSLAKKYRPRVIIKFHRSWCG